MQPTLTKQEAQLLRRILNATGGLYLWQNHEYSTAKWLVARGLAEWRAGDGRGSRDYMRLTEAGRAALGAVEEAQTGTAS